MAGARSLTREHVLEHALRALIHVVDLDVVEHAKYLCIERPGHSVLAARAADEIHLWRAADQPGLDFAAALPRPEEATDRG